MSVFEHYGRQAEQLEREIERMGIALGIDWDDPIVVADLARQALDFQPGQATINFGDPVQRARYELFGLADLMLKVMAESAQEHIHTHGGRAWKAFGGALWRAWQARRNAGGKP